MSIESTLKNAVRDGVTAALVAEIEEIVAKETRRVLREREDDLTRLVRVAVRDALEEALT